MRWSELDQEACSVARTVSVIGDRWSLLILRDCFLRIRRFDDFQERLGVTRHILADRLKKLVDLGVLRRQRYVDRPPRYEYRLTEKGIELYPVLLALVHWGDRHMADAAGAPLLHRHKGCGALFEPVMVCSVCGEPLEAREVTVEEGPGAATSTLPLLAHAHGHEHR
ncbi:transcriptional regulator, HxlR family [Rhizobiales bacterium GAS188]|nr:transcriptional regulator, HxlR family [Rhizobiales bacterium GAS188]